MINGDSMYGGDEGVDTSIWIDRAELGARRATTSGQRWPSAGAVHVDICAEAGGGDGSARLSDVAATTPPSSSQLQMPFSFLLFC